MAGTPIEEKVRELRVLPENAICGNESQGVLVKNRQLSITDSMHRGGVYCRDTGVDEKDFPAGSLLDKITAAFKIVDNLDKRVDLYGPCNSYFRSLPQGKSFRHHWRSGGVFINFSHPRRQGSSAPRTTTATLRFQPGA